MLLTWRQRLPVCVTLLALLTACASMVMSMHGQADRNPAAFTWAALLILITLLLDGLDGNVARWLDGVSAFGADLDTYVDFAGYAIAPALLLYAIWPTGFPVSLRELVPALIVIFGAIRLSRFRLYDTSRGLQRFIGLPMTMNASYISLWVILGQHNTWVWNAPLPVSLFFICLAILLPLQVSRVHYPSVVKAPHTYALSVISITALAFIVWLAPSYATHGALIVLLIGCVYVLVVPLVLRRRDQTSYRHP